MLADGTDHVCLDARHVRGAGDRASRPSPRTAWPAGVDPTVDLIPVAPAAHYASGGVRTDLYGRTSIAGPLRLRRGRLHRRARREPARLQLAARRAGLLPADRRGHRCATCRRSATGARRRRRSPGRRGDPAARDTAAAGDDPRRRGAAQRRDPGRRPPRAAGRQVGHAPHRDWERPTCSPWRARWSAPRRHGGRREAATGGRISPTRDRRGGATCSPARCADEQQLDASSLG